LTDANPIFKGDTFIPFIPFFLQEEGEEKNCTNTPSNSPFSSRGKGGEPEGKS
jgi:hypothetical protein